MMITRKQYERMWSRLTTKLYEASGEEIVPPAEIIDEALDAILKAGNIEVEEPPVMPRITGGKWVPVKELRVVKVGNLHIANVVGVTGAEGIANAVFMAGAKEVTLEIIKYLEWLVGSIDANAPAELWDLLEALFKQGCNVDKFRDEKHYSSHK